MSKNYLISNIFHNSFIFGRESDFSEGANNRIKREHTADAIKLSKVIHTLF